MIIAGGECLKCGLIFAPAQSFGCERCGAFGDQLAARNLPPIGKVVSRAEVIAHRFPTPPTPFTILEVLLDAGPVIRVVGAEGYASDYDTGAIVVAQTTAKDGLMRFAPFAGAAA